MSKLYVPRTFEEVKRLTNSELAAEYWHSWNLLKTGASVTHWSEYDRAMTIRRFATTPSYDEVDS